MGKKSKSSRKGKKAWRTNISTEDIEDFLEKSTKDSLSGGSLTNLSSDSLFYLDKSKDLSVKRKIEKQREKVVRWDSVLEKNAFVKPVPSSSDKKPKKRLKEVHIPAPKQDDGVGESAMNDLWDEKGESSSKTKKISKPSIIPAVEIEPPGCSFNPTFDSHQDSLARAVADEMQKVYQKELGPEPVPLTVTGEAIDEEDMYFLEVDHGSDEEEDESKENPGENEDTEKKPLKTKRVTRVKLNRRARHKEQLKMNAASMKVKNLSKEIDSIPDIIQEIAKEDEEKNKRHIRRTVAKQERLKTRPPRFGRHKFQPAPSQVLLSEEITGSLRKLKGCCTLARDRFKSLEKRGLIVPTAKSGRK